MRDRLARELAARLVREEERLVGLDRRDREALAPAIAIAVHDGLKCETTNAQLAATAGLRKNLNVSKPSIGASFHAPPNAEIQPKKLPTVTTTSQRGQRATGAVLERADREEHADARDARRSTPIVIRFFASFIGLPMTPNCIGMKYLLWSSSRMKYFQNSVAARSRQ